MMMIVSIHYRRSPVPPWRRSAARHLGHLRPIVPPTGASGTGPPYLEVAPHERFLERLDGEMSRRRGDDGDFAQEAHDRGVHLSMLADAGPWLAGRPGHDAWTPEQAGPASGGLPPTPLPLLLSCHVQFLRDWTMDDLDRGIIWPALTHASSQHALADGQS